MYQGELHVILCWHEYAEPVVSSFSQKIKSKEYSRNISLFIEGIEFEHFYELQHPSTLLSSGICVSLNFF